MNSPPAVERHQHHEEIDAALPAGPPVASHAERVLIVDDRPDNLALLHDALDEAGYTVMVATSARWPASRSRTPAPA